MPNNKTEKQIPKIIHYCWFGKDKNGNRNIKPQIVIDCIESWQKYMPEYEIIEWSEDNFDPYTHPYTKLAYENKKWAFVTDYVRLYALQKYGGIYLDTDMYIVKSINDLIKNRECIVAKEDETYINAAFLASCKNSNFINDVIGKYNKQDYLETIPRILSEIYNNKGYNEVKVLDHVYFYPFNADNIKSFKYSNKDWENNAPSESYGVHLWNYSWGHPLNKFIKKIGLHKTLKNILEMMGIKKIIKKILGME